MAQQIKYNPATGGESWITDLMGAGLDLWGAPYGLDIPDEAYSSTKFGKTLAQINRVAKPVYGTAQQAAMSMVAGQVMGGAGASTGELPVGEEMLYRQMGGDATMPYEAEGGEVIEQGDAQEPMVMGNGQTQEVGPGAVKVQGPQHEQGGVDMQGGQYVFSDTLKTLNGETFAKAAEKLYAELEKITKLYAKNNDRFSRSAYKRMAERVATKLSDLRGQQEAQRAQMPAQQQMGEMMKKGGPTKRWIQKAINPAHKGWCTPLTKSTCTGPRRALALRFKRGEFKKRYGGFIAGNEYDVSKDDMMALKSMGYKFDVI